MNSQTKRIKMIVSKIAYFSQYAGGVELRPYQLEVADAIVDSVLKRRGLTFVVIFPRQSGKNETQAQIQSYLLTLLSHRDDEIVSVSPTFKPQTVNAMYRLQRRLQRNLITRNRYKKSAGYIFMIGLARILFFSGDPAANTVGATASALLNIDEAQDILEAEYDKKFAPMTASTNATRVFWGTSWTSKSLLAREKRAALAQQEKDGIRRVWILTADDVSAVHPIYGEFVDGEIKRLGRNHPLIKTQYFSEEIDAEIGMFNAGRLALMLGDQPGHDQPAENTYYVFLLDVAGQDEARMAFDDDAPLSNPGRDSVSLTIASVDLTNLETQQAPTFRFVNRQQWIGQNHLTIFGKLKNLAEIWHPQQIVMDATGVGEGLWAMLDKAFPNRIIPVKFSQQVKSEIGWRYLAIIETGRLHDCCMTDAVRAQYTACHADIKAGPAKTLRWGVPEGTRGADGELLHDDYLLADALIAEIDRLDWSLSTDTAILDGIDPLLERKRDF